MCATCATVAVPKQRPGSTSPSYRCHMTWYSGPPCSPTAMLARPRFFFPPLPSPAPVPAAAAAAAAAAPLLAPASSSAPESAQRSMRPSAGSTTDGNSHLNDSSLNGCECATARLPAIAAGAAPVACCCGQRSAAQARGAPPQHAQRGRRCLTLLLDPWLLLDRSLRCRGRIFLLLHWSPLSRRLHRQRRAAAIARPATNVRAALTGPALKLPSPPVQCTGAGVPDSLCGQHDCVLGQ